MDGEISALTEEKVQKINDRVNALYEKYQKEQESEASTLILALAFYFACFASLACLSRRR